MWIAREQNGDLYIYTRKPRKGKYTWEIPNGSDVIEITRTAYKGVKWSDPEPRELVLKPINE